VADNPSLPENMLERLAVRGTYKVRGAVSCNAATPGAALDVLASDPNPLVRYCATRYEGALGRWAERHAGRSSERWARTGRSR
jgi:hypothetical protein